MTVQIDKPPVIDPVKIKRKNYKQKRKPENDKETRSDMPCLVSHTRNRLITKNWAHEASAQAQKVLLGLVWIWLDSWRAAGWDVEQETDGRKVR